MTIPLDDLITPINLDKFNFIKVDYLFAVSLVCPIGHVKNESTILKYLSGWEKTGNIASCFLLPK